MNKKTLIPVTNSLSLVTQSFYIYVHKLKSNYRNLTKIYYFFLISSNENPPKSLHL
jgi:hypothetical protein